LRSRLSAPLIGGCAIALVVAGSLYFWDPEVSAITIAAFLVGLMLKRWWLVPLPFLVAFVLAVATDTPCPSSASECDVSGIVFFFTLVLGAIATAMVLIGVATGRLDARAGATSARRRSS
jgi:hypothetical protein